MKRGPHITELHKLKISAPRSATLVIHVIFTLVIHEILTLVIHVILRILSLINMRQNDYLFERVTTTIICEKTYFTKNAFAQYQLSMPDSFAELQFCGTLYFSWLASTIVK